MPKFEGKPYVITVEQLQAIGACESFIVEFKELFGGEAEINEGNIAKAKCIIESHITWIPMLFESQENRDILHSEDKRLSLEWQNKCNQDNHANCEAHGEIFYNAYINIFFTVIVYISPCIIRSFTAAFIWN